MTLAYLMAGAAGFAAWIYYKKLNRLEEVCPRTGASWRTLSRRCRYRGGRKGKSAARRIEKGFRKVRLFDVKRTGYGEYEVTV